MPSGNRLPNFGDFTQITCADTGKFDLLVGGTPCTDFSVAGKRKGFEGSRGSLTYEYVRLLRRTMPDWFVWENVPGVLQGNMRRGFAAFIWSLHQLGYTVEWRIIDAQFCRVDGFPRAVPQRRRRLFVVGYLGDYGRQPILLEPPSSLGDSPPRRKTGTGITCDAENIVRNNSSWDVQSYRITDSRDAVPTLSGCDGGGGRHPGGFFCMASGQANAEIQEELSPTLNCDHEQPIIAIAGNIIGRQPQNGGNGTGFDVSGSCYTLTGTDRHAVCIAASDTAIDTVGSANPDNSGGAVNPAVAFEPRYYTRGQGGAKGSDIAGALSAQSHGSSDAAAHVATGSIVRRLIPVEAERLMGFADNWTCIPWRGRPEEKCPDSPRYKALGNSMAVNIMRWIGRRIQAAIENSR